MRFERGFLALIVLGAALAALPAVGQPRAPRLELLDAGDLGGEPRMPALAGGVWNREPLILGVEPDLDRTVLYRLAWLERGAAPNLPGPDRPRQGETAGADAPELQDVLEGTVATGSAGPARGDVAPAAGRPQPIALEPGLPEIVPFEPLPPGVDSVALAGSVRDGLLAWVAREGSPEVPLYRLAARRFAVHGKPAGGDLTLQVGPGRPADLAVAVAPDGEALIAWTNHLAGRGAALHWRSVGHGGEIGALRRQWDIASDQGSPSVAVLPGGFALAHLETPLQGQPPEPLEGGDDEVAGRGPDRALRIRKVSAGDASPRGEASTVAQRPGLDHPQVRSRGGAAHVFWTDPRGGGRMLRSRAVGSDAVPAGADFALRTDLRASEPEPFRVLPAADGLWLVVWPQLEGRGRAMVLQARLFHGAGNAVGPPALVGRSGGDLALRDVVESRGADRWIAVWTEEEAGRFRLRYRPLLLK
ncbi:MAG: hypothetical protein FJZ01_04130 [Candidatus Sericytochromatia bacterium]|nr:hypothetical protein [Candidatus Tanganyikabacteria bacterium]